MTPARRAEIERFVRNLERCRPPYQVALHHEAVRTIRELLTEIDNHQRPLFRREGDEG